MTYLVTDAVYVKDATLTWLTEVVGRADIQIKTVLPIVEQAHRFFCILGGAYPDRFRHIKAKLLHRHAARGLCDPRDCLDVLLLDTGICNDRIVNSVNLFNSHANIGRHQRNDYKS